MLEMLQPDEGGARLSDKIRVVLSAVCVEMRKAMLIAKVCRSPYLGHELSAELQIEGRRCALAANTDRLRLLAVKLEIEERIVQLLKCIERRKCAQGGAKRVRQFIRKRG